MKRIWKNVSTYALIALVSVGAAYGMFTYLNSNKNYSDPSDTASYGHVFDQGNVHLASLDANGYPDFTQAAETTVHAVVHIKSVVQNQASESGRRGRAIDPFEFFFGPGYGGGGGGSFEQQQPRPSVGSGSGVIISKDGYIITNNHVIDRASELEVTLNDNSKFKAHVVGADPNTDIALIKIDGSDFPYISFGNSDELKVGEWVLAVGNPFNLTSTVTAGIVSAKGRGNIGANTGSIQSFIQTDAAINPGNSGGALVNIRGQLVGINTAIYSQTGNFAGYGFAVPMSIAGKVVADIKEYGVVQRAQLGVSIRDLSVEKEINPEKTKDIKRNDGVYVGGFAEQSPAKQVGIEEGDIITSVNDVRVRTSSELQEQVSRYRPGDKIKLGVVRNNTEQTFNITLKNSDGNTSVVKKEDGLAIVGAAFKEISTEKKKEYGISYGVEVTGVDKNGEFHKEGITRGFIIQKINDKSVNTPEDVERMIQVASNSPEKVLFLSGFYPSANAKRKYYVIELNK